MMGEDAMKSISTFAVAMSLVVGGAVVAAPAFAQKKQAAATQAEPKQNLSKEERATLLPLQNAISANDFATAANLLPAAQAAAKGADARYILAGLQLKIAINSKDEAGQAAAVEAMLASGKVAQQDQARLYGALGSFYTNLNQPDRAAAALQKLGELDPNNPQPILALAEARAKENKPAEAISLIERAISAQKAAGQAVPENWYKRALSLAYGAKLAPQTAKLSRDLVAAYPTQDNWRSAVTIYRQAATLDKQTDTDVLRFMRAAKAMKGDADYFALASNLNDMGLPGESKAVIDEGVTARAISPTKDYFRQLLAATGGRVSGDRASLPSLQTKAMAAPNGKLALSTADAYYGYGDYAKAAVLYRAAIQKGGVDNNVANTRLGAALALSGQRADAETAFKAVTGNRANLAAFWMLWLSQRG
jgi:tetratricopeptide (TPR) repeat protein